MAGILYPGGRIANFARGKDKQKRKKRTLGGYALTGAKYGALLGAGIGVPTYAYLGNQYMKSNPGFLPSKGMPNTPGSRRLVTATAGLGGGLEAAAKLGLVGAGLGAGAYGLGKLKERLSNRNR